MRACADGGELRADVESMKVRQIKAELDALGRPHDDLFEKSDLVQRLVDARSEPADGAAGGPTDEQIREGVDMFNADPESSAIMAELEASEKLQRAAMDIAANGDASRYADDEEVMDFMRRLEQVTKRGMA